MSMKRGLFITVSVLLLGVSACSKPIVAINTPPANSVAAETNPTADCGCFTPTNKGHLLWD